MNSSQHSLAFFHSFSLLFMFPFIWCIIAYKKKNPNTRNPWANSISRVFIFFILIIYRIQIYCCSITKQFDAVSNHNWWLKIGWSKSVTIFCCYWRRSDSYFAIPL
jgi:heme A synthase